jgi:hypothetical protein
MRVVVAGLFNSGSTCLAGCLHRLGVDMGSPFWINEQDNYYEPYDLSCLIRHFWSEPYAIENTPEPIRIQILQNWVVMREALGYQNIGAKHPLLALSLNDLLQAWGSKTKFVWSYRPLRESIAKLQKRGWFGDKAEYIQQQLWRALQVFHSEHKQRCLVIDYRELRTNRTHTIHELVRYLEISPSQSQLLEAINWVEQE